MKKSEQTTLSKLGRVRQLLENELEKLDDVTNEDSENFDSEYTSLRGNGVNCFEADAALRPVIREIFAIMGWGSV
jgi:hypothetical protein